MIRVTWILLFPVLIRIVAIMKDQQKWIGIALVNLCIVAALGVVLRYKIAFALPFVHQKHLLHGHSHFAFTGWVSQALMTILTAILTQRSGRNLFVKFRPLLLTNLILSYAMLVSFTLQGYAAFSIACSTGSILVAYAFGIMAWKEMNAIKQDPICFRYFKVAILFNFISSIGTFWLAYLMVEKNFHQNWYLAAVYFFLHFQYNGWFIFSLLGILSAALEQKGMALKHSKTIFTLLSVTLPPAYLLSTLWAELPSWVYWLVVSAAIIQLAAWVLLFQEIVQMRGALRSVFGRFTTVLISIALLALTLKFLLQALSTIPVLGQFAFGIRPIVVAYLHLVLLAVVTVFLLAYAYEQQVIPRTQMAHAGIVIFVSGVLMNELLLMLQGISFISPVDFGIANTSLFYLALVMFSGTSLLVAATGR